MDESKPIIGQSDRICFSLEWDSSAPGDSDLAANLTRGRLVAHVGGQVVWGKSTPEGTVGLDWTWVELVEHLARTWNRLIWEEIDPLGVNEIFPRRLRVEAENRWANLAPDAREPEEQIFWAFEESHNLAAGLQGIWPARIWIIRQGTMAFVTAGDIALRLPIKDVLNLLSQLGDAICVRLQESRDPRSVSALAAWNKREQITPGEFVAISTGLPPSHIAALVGSRRSDMSFWGIRPRRLESTEILAMARMAGTSLPPRVLGEILERIRHTRKTATPDLDCLCGELRRLVADRKFGQPCDEGCFLATEMRRRLQNEIEPVDPEALLRSWGVAIKNKQLAEASHLDAVCCWGPKHGPLIIVNKAGKHAHDKGGYRATLAHEICHLLIDRQEALPLGEALGGRVAEPVEIRARAFAAEFLLPRHIVSTEWQSTVQPDSLVQRLMRRFGVSREVVAWQAKNSGVQLNPAQYHYLRNRVSHPERF